MKEDILRAAIAVYEVLRDEGFDLSIMDDGQVIVVTPENTQRHSGELMLKAFEHSQSIKNFARERSRRPHPNEGRPA